MKFQEGMRRIGLTVGVLGALVTAYLAFFTFSDMATARKSQAEFEVLMELPITQTISKDIAKSNTTNTYVEIQGHPHGINQIHVNDKGAIEWFAMDDGKTIARTQAPSTLWYLLYPLAVAVGFLVPWGIVRLVTWLVSGFMV